MNPAFAPFETLPGFRARGDDQFQASCPTSAHPHGDRSRGLSGRIFGTKVVLKCFAGCSTEDILAATGLDWQALFGDAPLHRDSGKCRRYRSVEDVRQPGDVREWRESEMMQAATELRDRDHIFRLINNCVFAGLLTEEEATPIRAFELKGYCELERRFETLRTGSSAEVEELWSVRDAV